MRLHLYFMRRFLSVVAIVFGVFFALYVLVETEAGLRRFRTAGADLGDALGLALLKVPGELVEILPVMVLLAALFFSLRLSQTSELVVARAAGRSLPAALAAPALGALLVGVLVVTAVSPVVAALTRQHALVTQRLVSGDAELSISAEGLWLRQATETGQTVIHARRVGGDGTRLAEVSIFELSNSGGLEAHYRAARAELSDGEWQLSDGKSWALGADQSEPEAAAQTFAQTSLPAALSREQVRDGLGTPAQVGFWDLPGFIARLQQAGFAPAEHLVHLHRLMALPVLLAAMTLIGAGFMAGHARAGGAGLKALLAVLAGFSVFFLANFAAVLGRNGEIPPPVAGWSLPLAAFLLGATLLLFREEG